MSDSPSSWLRPRTDEPPATLPPLGQVLRDYRAENHLTQKALGQLLQVDQTYISMIERGRRRIRDVSFLLRVARLLGIPPADLGLSNDLLGDAASPLAKEWHGADGERLSGPMEAVKSDQTDWCAVRRYLNHHRSGLAKEAASLYPKDLRVRRTTLIAPRSWLPTEPVNLADITMTWVPDAPSVRVPAISGQQQRSGEPGDDRRAAR